ncbi:MAG: energy-coupling factor ABC transporter permease [Caldilineales bacterium]|nr:energy-coupling factor ABC transporter permease [Caldilineales bacterium]MCW5856828.1 energy-coupling factor ABC transporter permease [Caldilineales bacterium]
MLFGFALAPSTPAMHIPDGFLSLGISLVFWALTVAFVSVAARRVQNDLGERQIPVMGIMAAFIFAAQMLNFPVAGGTSGHLLGGALAAIVLGPWAGILVMTAVIGVQGLLFQDGGLVVMGANIFNMGVLTALVGFGLYRGVAGRSRSQKLAVAGVAAWVSVMAAALLTALQLWLSGTSALGIVVPAMLGVHALIGLGEALITVAALAFILRTRPDLLGGELVREKGGPGWVVGGAVVVLLLVLLAPFASASPDGLERVAGNLGFLNRGASSPFTILPDYTLPWLGQTSLSTVVAGLIGAAVVGLLAIGVIRLLRRRAASAI